MSASAAADQSLRRGCSTILSPSTSLAKPHGQHAIGLRALQRAVAIALIDVNRKDLDTMPASVGHQLRPVRRNPAAGC